MIDEAVKAGLRVNPRTVNQLAWGIQRKNSPFQYVAPDPDAMLHNSLHGAWWLLEFLPKSASYKEWPERQTHFGFYIPDAEPRPIPEGAFVHESVTKRMDDDQGLSADQSADEVRDGADAGEAGACRR